MQPILACVCEWILFCLRTLYFLNVYTCSVKEQESKTFLFSFLSRIWPSNYSNNDNYFNDKNTFQPKQFFKFIPIIILYNRETIQVQLTFHQILTSTANILRMQASQHFSFGIIAYHCNLYIIHKCGLLTESESGNLIPHVFWPFYPKIWHVFANISVILLSCNLSSRT